MNPTERALVACCRVGGGRPGESDVGDIGDVDWARFQRLAAWHRVAGVAHRALGGTGPAAVGLAAAYNETLARNLVALAELDRLAGELERAGITAMLLKGAALLRAAYDDLGTRPMYDLDLLLREHDVPRAGAVLGELGYRPAPQFAGMADRLWEEHGRWVPLLRPDGMVVVELHRRLGDRGTALGFDVDAWWDRSCPAEHPTLRRPSVEDLLVHVALHALGDRRLRSEGALGQLRDVATVASGAAGPVEWARLDGAGPGLGLVLGAVQKLALADVPVGAVDGALVDELIRRRVLRDDQWITLERFGPRTTALRQLLPPRPARLASRKAAAYAAWARAAARIVARSGDLRGEVSFDRAVRALLAPA